MRAEPLYLREFGPEWQVPAAVANDSRFLDASWHNDICPSFACGVRVYLWCDHPDAAKRELPEAARYTVTDRDGSGGPDSTLLETDDVAEAIAFAVAKAAEFGGPL